MSLLEPFGNVFPTKTIVWGPSSGFARTTLESGDAIFLRIAAPSNYLMSAAPFPFPEVWVNQVLVSYPDAIPCVCPRFAIHCFNRRS